MQQYSITQPAARIVPTSRETPTDISSDATILGICIVSLSVLATLSTIIYKQYRTMALRRQIAILEKTWHLHSSDTFF